MTLPKRNLVLSPSILLVAGLFSALPARNEEDSGPLPERFFPFGVLASVKECGFFGESWTREVSRHVRDWKRHYVNTVCAYGMGVPPGDAPRMLEILAPYRIKGWLSLYMPTAYKDRHVLDECAAFLEAQRGRDGVLAYTIKDEPGTQHFLPYVDSLRFIARHDPTHPVVSIFSRASSLYPYLPYLDAMCIDCYPILQRTHDPWYVAMEVADVRRIAGNRPVWFMPQTHSFYAVDYHKMPRRKARREEIPSIPEHHLMTNLALAEGADGLVWFLYRWMPTWHELKGRGLVNLIEEGTPLWKEIEQQGRTLLPIGPLIAGTSVFPCHGVRVKTDHVVPMPECIFRVDPPKRKPRPAVTAAVRGYPNRSERFLFLVNNDVTQRRSGSVSLDRAFYPEAHVYDLIDVTEVSLTNDARFTVTLAPGRGRIYLIGSPDIFNEARAVIRRNRRQGEIDRLGIDVEELADAGVLADPDVQTTRLHRAARLNIAGTTEQADILVQSVRHALQTAIENHPEYRRRRILLDRAASMWSRMDNELDARAVAIEYGARKTLHQELADMVTLAKQYMDLKTALLGPHGTSEPDETAVPSTERLTTLVRDLTRLARRLERKLAAIPPDGDAKAGANGNNPEPGKEAGH